VDVQLKKGGQWVPMTDELINAIYGGMISATQNLY
jgi:hypothetical protein